MIYIKLYGGLGNQLFQYAFGRSVSIKTEFDLRLDIISGFKNDFFMRNYQLHKFNIKAEISKSNEVNNRLILKNNLIGKAYRRAALYCPNIAKNYFKEKEKFNFDNDVYNINDNTYFHGYWQNIRYIDEIYEQLISEITLRKTPSQTFNEINAYIKSTNAIAIHIRLPHAISGENIHKKALDIFSIIQYNFYERAIMLIKDTMPDAKFFIFSNNKAWAKDILNKANVQDYYFIDSTGDDVEDFELMKSCNHFIIPNSTYSWWAAYLGIRKDKIVICPEKWFNNIELKKNEFFPSNWIIIKDEEYGEN